MSSSILDKKIDIFDTKKTPEIYPMTSIQETFEYFHEKMNQLNKRAYENSAMMQRLTEQVQQLSTRTHKPAASIEPAQQTAPQPASPVKAEKADVMSMLLRRFSQQPAVPTAPAVPEPVPSVDEFAPEPEERDLEEELEPELPGQSIHFRRFSEQQLESVQEHFRRFPQQELQLEAVQEPDTQPELDRDSEQDLSPCLWRRLAAKVEARQELESEPVLEPAVEPATPVRAHTSKHGLKRLSLCMMPPDEMQDVLDVISPEPAPSPALGAPGAAAADTSLFLR